ncbi:hypothetical protein PLICRDRAFT_172333 [Plicaturopsis crispa FD-325 SS-3]|nr:hypothetical protein PLICRDRAFT_172333 [Plicaturopsis crispa FD-325 SS-3]
MNSEIVDVTDMPSATVAPNAICGGLFSRADDTFHWAITLPSSDGSAVIWTPSTIWEVAGTGSTKCSSRSTAPAPTGTLCVLVQFGRFTQANTVDSIDRLFKSIPQIIPAVDQAEEPVFSCRVWFKEAVRVLNANGIVRCPDVYALENELTQYDEEQDAKTVTGGGYRTHIDASSV